MFFNLIIYVILKFIFNISTLSCPIPAGAFAPAFVLGAGFGRTYGYILKKLGIYFGLSIIKCTSSNLKCILDEGIYAIIGAAAVSGAATKTVAPAIIVLELTGQSTHLVPVFLGVLLSHCVFSNFSMSIFDVVLEFKNLPYLATLGSVEAYYQTAKHIMNKNFFFITKDAILADLPIVVNRVKSARIAIPVVESETKK